MAATSMEVLKPSNSGVEDQFQSAQPRKTKRILPPDVNNPELFGRDAMEIDDFLMDEEFPGLQAEAQQLLNSDDDEQTNHQPSLLASHRTAAGNLQDPKKIKSNILSQLNKSQVFQEGSSTSAPAAKPTVPSQQYQPSQVVNKEPKLENRSIANKDAVPASQQPQAPPVGRYQSVPQRSLLSDRQQPQPDEPKQPRLAHLSPASKHRNNVIAAQQQQQQPKVHYEFQMDQIDEFIRSHRSQIREITDCCKDETKLLANLTLNGFRGSNPRLDVGAEDAARENHMNEAFVAYVFELDALLEKKFRAMVELRQRIKSLIVDGRRAG